VSSDTDDVDTSRLQRGCNLKGGIIVIALAVCYNDDCGKFPELRG